MHAFSNRRLAFWALGTFLAIGPWAIQVPAPLRPSIAKNGADDSAVIREGLVAWRTPGGKFNSACSSCHAPDAFDLAQFNFDDANIRRRAFAHVDESNATKIIALVHAIRRKYNIGKPLDPMAERPLQPGGEVLPGATSTDRDLAFGKSLIPLLPTLMAGRVDSFDKAKKARDEMMA